MPEQSDSDAKAVIFKLYETPTTRIAISYKDKHDLFEAFKKRVAELSVPLDNIYWTSGEVEPMRLNNAEVLLEAAEFCNVPRLHVIRNIREDKSSSSCCADELGWCTACRSRAARYHRKSHSRRDDRARGGRSRSRERDRRQRSYSRISSRSLYYPPGGRSGSRHCFRSHDRLRECRHCHHHSGDHHSFVSFRGPCPCWQLAMYPHFCHYLRPSSGSFDHA